jgi:phosphatidylglycerophosphate synthase
MGDAVRLADAITVFRTLLCLLVVYLVLTLFNPWFAVLLIAIIFILDFVDGFAATYDATGGAIDLPSYVAAALWDSKMKKVVENAKRKGAKVAVHGPRIDVAGDRAVEYIFWILYAFLGIVPLVLVLLLVIRHSYADALMGSKGTSAKMKKGIVRTIYSSNFSRGLSGVLKAVTFAYLALVYVDAYPLIIGYVLIAVTFLFIMLRGFVEIYENL